MKRLTFYLLALIAADCFTLPALAQSDSSRLDLGYLELQKEFAQTTTIKGTDLEKMPFTSLSDALEAWLSGAYTQPLTLQYVVDGNPVSDVNAYSVFDIEEVVLVRNAAALVNTADGQQELVIVRTRRGQGRGGLTAAAQTGLVQDNTAGYHSPVRFYHNDYISAWRNRDKVSTGISANYLRDVDPQYSGLQVVTPDNLQRWRLNGYLTWRPDSHNQIGLQANYAPQQINNWRQDPAKPALNLMRSTTTQHALPLHLIWHSDFSSAWTSDFQASYVHATASATRYNNATVTTPADTLQQADEVEWGSGKSDHIWLRDRIRYRITAGQWRLEPAVSVSCEHYQEQKQDQLRDSFAGFSGTTLGPFNYSLLSSDAYNQKAGRVQLTPALSASYKQAIYVLGGVLVGPGSEACGGRTAFPFASLSIDLLRLADEHSSSSLRILGSYAQRTVPSPQGYGLLDLRSTGEVAFGWLQAGTIYSTTLTGPVATSYLSDSRSVVYWAWEGGVSFSSWQDRLTIQYTLEQRNFPEVIVNGPPGEDFVRVIRSTWHQLDFRLQALQGSDIRWLTAVTVAMIRNAPSQSAVSPPSQDIGDDLTGQLSWTGGWVNRIEGKHLAAGFDLLFHVGEAMDTISHLGGAIETVTVNSIITPNIYLGYRWRLAEEKGLECFVETRGLLHNNSSDLLDNRRFYTIGGKLTL